MASSEIAPKQRGSRLATLLTLGSCLLAVTATLGLTVLSMRIARLHDELATARKHADRRIDEASARLARLTLRLAETEKQTTLLVEAARPRSISKAQETDIVRQLAGITGQTVEVEALGTSQEARAFAEQSAQTLQAAGMASHTSLVIGPAVQGGLSVMCDAKAAPGIAKKIQSAFSGVGIPMSRVADSHLAGDTCLIVVGSKPSL